MSYIEELAAKLKLALATGPVPAKSLRVELKEEGGLVLTSSDATVGGAAADTTITMARKDFEALAAGKLSGPVAFMQGKLKIEGDPAVALQWAPVLQRMG